MPSFKQRSYQKELLDGNNIPFSDIQKNMQELDFINRKLGGHEITLKGLKYFLLNNEHNPKLNVVEIGCGGGDNLYAIKRFSKKNKLRLNLTGIDINPECIAFARANINNNGIDFICSDYKKIIFESKPDIIFSSLFCHHFSNEDLIYMLRWMKDNTTAGFFINDLHRHPLAYYSIYWLTRFFSRSYLVKNDAPLSVQRGFIKKDWQFVFEKAGLPIFECKWKWAFRWLVLYSNNGSSTTI